MPSRASLTFDHAIQDAVDLVNHFDKLNTQPPPPENEVLKRASLVMALAALETYFEDRLVEAVDALCGEGESAQTRFMRDSLVNDLKYFHTPSTDRVRPLFQKYLGADITEGWRWNNMEPSKERGQVYLLRLVRPLAWAMRRAGRSEASGLCFDHGLEGIAAQCALLLEIKANLCQVLRRRRTGPGVLTSPRSASGAGDAQGGQKRKNGAERTGPGVLTSLHSAFGAGDAQGEERGQVYLLRLVRPLAWAMRRAGRSEASGLCFDHGLEGIAAQCALLLEIKANLCQLLRRQGFFKNGAKCTYFGESSPGPVNQLTLSQTVQPWTELNLSNS